MNTIKWAVNHMPKTQDEHLKLMALSQVEKAGAILTLSGTRTSCGKEKRSKALYLRCLPAGITPKQLRDGFGQIQSPTPAAFPSSQPSSGLPLSPSAAQEAGTRKEGAVPEEAPSQPPSFPAPPGHSF